MMKLLHDIHSSSGLREPHWLKKKKNRAIHYVARAGLMTRQEGKEPPPPHHDDEASSGWSGAVHVQNSFSVVELGVQSEQEKKPLGDDADW